MPDEPNQQIHNIRVPFNKELFVERQEELEVARQWQASNRRVLTITSPPANGKTWFLNHFQNLLRDEGETVLEIDITDFLLGGAFGKREIDPPALKEYISDFAAKLRKKCNSVPGINESNETSVILTKLAKYVSERCWPGQPIYLFVDGGDEPSVHAWKTIEKQILEPIIAFSNWQMIIALRQSQRLYSHLLRRTEWRCALKPLPFSVDISQQGQDQLEKLISQYGQSTPTLSEILDMIPDYNWVHLGLNYFLFLQAREQQTITTNHLLKKGLLALTPLNDVDATLKHLQAISQLPPQWVVEELATRLNLPLSEVWKTVDFLQEHMLLTNEDNSYQITPGVQEFVRSLTPIRLKLQIDKDINEFAGNEFISDLSSELEVEVERIQIISIEQGSVNIILEIPQAYFTPLLQMFLAQDSKLERLRLLKIEPIITYGVSLTEDMQHGLTMENNKRQYRQSLRQLMENHFSLDELLTFCFDQSIDYENFERKKNSIVREIIELYERNGQLSDLLRCLRKIKPEIVWPAIVQGGIRNETVIGNR